MLQRVKEVQESDLRMVGALARNIQRVIAVTQAQIDAAAAQGKAWVVKPVVKVSDPIDNLRGGTQLVIKQNSILPGQNVMRVIYMGGTAVVVGPDVPPLSLPDATANDLLSLTAFGGTEQSGTPTPNTPVDIVSNNGVIVFRDTELPTAYRRILGMTMNNNCYYEITGFKMNGSDTLRFSFTRTGANACNVLGAYDGTSAQSNYSLYAGSSSSASYLRYNGGTYNSYAIADEKYDVVITPTGSDGMENDSTWTAKTFTSTTNLCIGTTSPSATSSKMVGSIHGSVVVDGRLELIPCERISDGELGYYDTNTGTFYEPIGTTPTSLGYDYTHCAILANGPIETIATKDSNSSTVSTATTEILLSVDTYTDQQEVISGSVARKCGAVILDSSFEWTYDSTYGRVNATIPNLWGSTVARTVPGFCTHFEWLSHQESISSITAGQCYSAGGNRIFLHISQTSADAFSAWLDAQKDAGTPVIIVFPLENATTDRVAGQPMQTAAGNNTAEITQAGMGGLELEVEYLKDE